MYWFAQFSGALAGALMLWGGISNVSFAPVNGIEKLANFTLGTSVVPAIQRPPFLLGANALNPALNPGNGLILEVGTYCLVVAFFPIILGFFFPETNSKIFM